MQRRSREPAKPARFRPVLDEETQLLQVTARTPADRSARLNDAYAALVDGLRAELTDWVQGWTPGTGHEVAATIGSIGVNALLGQRATSTLFHAPESEITDEHYIAEWSAMLVSRIETLH